LLWTLPSCLKIQRDLVQLVCFLNVDCKVQDRCTFKDLWNKTGQSPQCTNFIFKCPLCDDAKDAVVPARNSETSPHCFLLECPEIL
jgi:hypothetical protein